MKYVILIFVLVFCLPCFGQTLTIPKNDFLPLGGTSGSSEGDIFGTIQQSSSWYKLNGRCTNTDKNIPCTPVLNQQDLDADGIIKADRYPILLANKAVASVYKLTVPINASTVKDFSGTSAAPTLVVEWRINGKVFQTTSSGKGDSKITLFIPTNLFRFNGKNTDGSVVFRDNIFDNRKDIANQRYIITVPTSQTGFTNGCTTYMVHPMSMPTSWSNYFDSSGSPTPNFPSEIANACSSNFTSGITCLLVRRAMLQPSCTPDLNPRIEPVFNMAITDDPVFEFIQAPMHHLEHGLDGGETSLIDWANQLESAGHLVAAHYYGNPSRTDGANKYIAFLKEDLEKYNRQSDCVWAHSFGGVRTLTAEQFMGEDSPVIAHVMFGSPLEGSPFASMKYMQQVLGRKFTDNHNEWLYVLNGWIEKICIKPNNCWVDHAETLESLTVEELQGWATNLRTTLPRQNKFGSDIQYVTLDSDYWVRNRDFKSQNEPILSDLPGATLLKGSEEVSRSSYDFLFHVAGFTILHSFCDAAPPQVGKVECDLSVPLSRNGSRGSDLVVPNSSSSPKYLDGFFHQYRVFGRSHGTVKEFGDPDQNSERNTWIDQTGWGIFWKHVAPAYTLDFQ